MSWAWRSINYPSALWFSAQYSTLPLHSFIHSLIIQPERFQSLPSPGLFRDDRKLNGTSEGFRPAPEWDREEDEDADEEEEEEGMDWVMRLMAWGKEGIGLMGSVI